MAELSTWLLILLLTSPGTLLSADTGIPTNTTNNGNSSPSQVESSTVYTTHRTIDTTTISVTLSSRSEQHNSDISHISATDSTNGSPTHPASVSQPILSTDTSASSTQSEVSPTEASLFPSSQALTTLSIPSSSDSLAVHTQVNDFATSSKNPTSGLRTDSSSSTVSRDSTGTQEYTSQKTSLPVTIGSLLSHSSNTEPSSTHQSSPAGTAISFAVTHATTFSPAKASEATTHGDSTSHVSAESSSIMPGMLSASERMAASTSLHLSTSDIKTSASLSETTVLNRDVVGVQQYQSLLHKYHVTKTTLIAVSVGSGLLILFLLVTVAVLCCTRRTCKQAKSQSSQAASSFTDGSQLHSWEPSLPRPSIRPSVYDREVSVEMRDNLQRRQRSSAEQSRTADAANHERILATNGQVNEGFTSDASLNVPKQLTATQAGGHKSPPVTFGPVSVVTISATTPRISQPTTSPSPASLPSETKALTMPRMTTATTSSAQSETQPLQSASAHLDALNGYPDRGQPHKKRRELVYF